MDGSEVGTCFDCGEDIWIAPSSKDIATERGKLMEVQYSCLACGLAAMILDPNPVVEEFTPEQMTEIRQRIAGDVGASMTLRELAEEQGLGGFLLELEEGADDE